MIKVDYVSSNITDVQEILKLDNSYNCDMYSEKQILDFFNINYYRMQGKSSTATKKMLRHTFRMPEHLFS